MLFGARTESKRNLALGPAPSSASALAVTADSAAVDGQGAPAGQAALPPRQPKPGHGRNGAQAYSGGAIVECDHS